MSQATSSAFTPITKADLEDPSLNLLNQQIRTLFNLVNGLYTGSPTLQGSPTFSRALVLNQTPASGNELVCQNWVENTFVSK